MSAESIPDPAPATAADLGHRIRYPVKVDNQRGGTEWRAGCHCHYWWLLDPTEAEAAIK